MANQDVKISSCFGPLVNKPVATVTDYSKDKDIVEYSEEEYVEKTGEGDKDFVVKKRVIESSRVNRAEYIASFADDVGIQNILKKVQKTGDQSLLIQCKGPFIDVTGLPESKEEAFDKVNEGVKAFDNLPDEIKGKMSLADFVTAFGQDEFNKYINQKAAEIAAAKAAESKGEEK